MDESNVNSRATATDSSGSSRQSRRGRQCDRAVWALLGLTVLAVLFSKVVWSLSAEAHIADQYPLSQSTPHIATDPRSNGPPREDDRPFFARYVVEPSDVLLLGAVDLVPKAARLIRAQDVLQIAVNGTPIGEVICGEYAADEDGNIQLGFDYGMLKVLDQTVAEAQVAIEEHLRATLRAPEVVVCLAQAAGQQQIAGEHLVGPDGTIDLGANGSVYVAGLYATECKFAIEEQLKNDFDEPRVSVDVHAYNSKVYYLIIERAGKGDSIIRVPISGNETVLDALAQVNGLPQLGNKNIWIARPAPEVYCDQILPVNWDEITKGGAPAGNYQVLPGDRIFIADNKVIALDNWFDRCNDRVEWFFGYSSLSSMCGVTQRNPLRDLLTRTLSP
jgi:polysaccharide biosynthesis/export protein